MITREQLQRMLNGVAPDMPIMVRERIDENRDRLVTIGAIEIAVVRWDEDRQGYVYAPPSESGETVVLFG